MENKTSSYAVLLSKPVAHDPMALAKALATVRKTPLQDQIIRAKSCWGILADNLGRSEAEALVQGLHQGGIESKIFPAAEIVSLPKTEELLTIQSLPAVKPALIASAAITITSTTTKSVKEGPSSTQKVLSVGIMLTTGLPIRIGGKTHTVEKTQHHSDQVFYMDLLYKNPSRRLRVDAQKFDYAFLKERKLYQMLGNFKLLVGEMVKAAPEAWKNHGTRVLMEGKPVQTMGYGSLADLERETRWLLTLIG